MRRYLSGLCAILLSGCAGTFYVPAPGTPTANVRFVATYGGNTEFIRSDSVQCDAMFRGKLGWFNPGGDQNFQAERRGFNRREGIPGGEAYPSHMYSEMRVDSDKPFFVTVASTAGRSGSISPFDVQICVRAAELPVHTGRNYELIHVRDGDKCDLRFVEVSQTSGGVSRKEINLISKSPMCTGHGTPRS